jgi:hypothetical protein
MTGHIEEQTEALRVLVGVPLSDPADRRAFLNRFMASSAPSQLADVVPRIVVQRMSGARSMLAAAASVRDRKA